MKNFLLGICLLFVCNVSYTQTCYYWQDSWCTVSGVFNVFDPLNPFNPPLVGHVIKDVNLIIHGSYDCGNAGFNAQIFQANGNQGCGIVVDPSDMASAGGSCTPEYNQTFNYGFVEYSVVGYVGESIGFDLFGLSINIWPVDPVEVFGFGGEIIWI